MLELSNSEKERIGKLLKYYRKKNKIQWKVIKEVISTSTYSNMEKGKVFKDSTLYDDVFYLYGIDQIRKDNFKEWLSDYLIRFNDILEWYKEDEFDSLIYELEKELGPYKASMIYQEYYQVLYYILNYYKYSKYMTLEEINDVLLLFRYFEFEDTIMIYLIETMFISNNNLVENNQIMEELYKLIGNYNQYSLIWYVEAGYNKCHAKLDSALNLFQKSFEYYSKLENKYRSVRSLMGKYIIYKNIDNRKAEETAEELLALKEQNRLYISMIPNINFNIGMYYYLNKKYENALPLFIENLTIYKTFREWLYLCAICTQLNIPIPNEINDIDVNKHPLDMCLKYFHMKHNKVSNNELVNYVMKEIVPNILIYEEYKQPLWKIFEEELFCFTKNDKRFTNAFIEFLEIEKKTCKNG